MVRNHPPRQETREAWVQVRKTPWNMKWQPALGFLPRKYHEQRRLVGYSPWGCTESDMTEHAGSQPASSMYSTKSRPFVLIAALGFGNRK